LDLSSLHGKRIAVVLKRDQDELVVPGVGRYEQDAMLGMVLRISPTVPSAGDPMLLLQEEQWDREIRSDELDGCDYRIDVSISAADAS
jgi:hypothetical protein